MLSAQEIVAFTEVHNGASRAVMERLGMTFAKVIYAPGLVGRSGVLRDAAPFALYRQPTRIARFSTVKDAVMIRPARADDLRVLQHVYREASLSNPGDRDDLLTHPEYLVFAGSGIAAGRTTVALVDDLPVGFASVADGPRGKLELEDLFVEPQWQRRGIARLLVNDVIQTARANGARTLMVTGNPHARPFYLAVGFVESGVEATTFGPAPRFRLNLD